MHIISFPYTVRMNKPTQSMQKCRFLNRKSNHVEIKAYLLVKIAGKNLAPKAQKPKYELEHGPVFFFLRKDSADLTRL